MNFIIPAAKVLIINMKPQEYLFSLCHESFKSKEVKKLNRISIVVTTSFIKSLEKEKLKFNIFLSYIC